MILDAKSTNKAKQIKATHQCRPKEDHLSPTNDLSNDLYGLQEQAEIERLYRDHNDSLLRFLSIKLGSPHEAKDVAQEAYVKILGLDRKGEINHLQAYLFKTANNLAINRLKQRSRRKEAQNIDIHEVDITDENALTERSVDARTKLNKLDAIILEIPPKCRMAFLLYKMEGLEYSEIAQRMQISESMVRKYVLRAVRYCLNKLENG